MITSILLTLFLNIASAIICPNNWVRLNTNCYNVFTTLLSYEEAIKFCSSQANNSYLAEIRSDFELSFLQTLVDSKASRNPVWV